MFPYTKCICKDGDIAAILIPASPDAERVVAAQPLADMAYQVLGDPNVLEIVTTPDVSLTARNTCGSTSQLAAPPIFIPTIALRRQKASYVFGNSSGSNVYLHSAETDPEEFEMTLSYTAPGVHTRFFTNHTYINNRSMKVGTQDLLEATQIQIQTFMFHVIPLCSFTSAPDTSTSFVSETSPADLQQQSLNDFRRGPKIGERSQGNVYVYRSKKSQQPLVVKILEPVDPQEVKRATREVLISPKVNHEFLFKVLEVHKFPEGTALLMPLLEHGSLYDYMGSRQGYSSIREAKSITVQLLLGTAHLHSMLIMHRDMKPTNIMISSLEPYLTIKLADFGMAVWSRKAFSVAASLPYCAPEVYKFQRTEKYDNKVDTFPIGMVGLELLGIYLRYTMYGSQNAFDIEVGMRIEEEIQSATSQEKAVAFRTLQAMTVYYPVNRPKVAACFGLGWFERSKKEWRPDVEE